MLLPEHLNNDNGDFKVILMFASLVLTEKLLGEVVYQSSCVMQNIHLERVHSNEWCWTINFSHDDYFLTGPPS